MSLRGFKTKKSVRMKLSATRAGMQLFLVVTLQLVTLITWCFVVLTRHRNYVSNKTSSIYKQVRPKLFRGITVSLCRTTGMYILLIYILTDFNTRGKVKHAKEQILKLEPRRKRGFSLQRCEILYGASLKSKCFWETEKVAPGGDKPDTRPCSEKNYGSLEVK